MIELRYPRGVSRSQTGKTEQTNPKPARRKVKVFLSNENHEAKGDDGIYFPKATASVSRITPITVASFVLPGLNLNIQIPMNIAIGIVAAMVKVPHELSARAFTTTIPNPARDTIMMIKVAREVVKLLVSFLISNQAISDNDLPS
jgi:hypothetical protein